MKRKEMALNYFKNNCNCSQSVFTAYVQKYGVSEKDAMAIATGFGAGVARSQNICGAVSGAIMALGYKNHDHDDRVSSKNKTYAESQELMKEFKKKHASVVCRDLIGIDFDKNNGFELANEMGLFETRCAYIVSDVCEILDNFCD